MSGCGVGITDLDWFKVLRTIPLDGLVNWWTPTDWSLKSMHKGERWYFLLKSPIRKIGGFGIFERYDTMSIAAAWKNFGKRNGALSLEQLEQRTEKYRARTSARRGDGIGCILLSGVQLFHDDEFLDADDVKLQVVTWKRFEKDPWAGEAVALPV